MRRELKVTCLAATALFCGFCGGSTATAASAMKKGVGTWAFPGETETLTEVNASWFYTWSPKSGGITAPMGVTFVPMIWGSTEVTSANLDFVKSESSVVLGFNEPDMKSQSNVSPQTAVMLWPQLVATGLRLGSPAPAANAQVAGGWLDTFMAGIAKQGLRVDFICLHWYGGTFDTQSAVAGLKSYIDETHARYNLPIWVTEFALTNYGSSPPKYPTDAQQTAFAGAAVAMLDATSYVERYAWFELPPCETDGGCGGDNKALASADGGLTSVGVAYAGSASSDAGTAKDADESLDGGASSASADSGSGTPNHGPTDADASPVEGSDAAGASGKGQDGRSAAASRSSNGCVCSVRNHGGSVPGGAAAVALGVLVAWMRAVRRRSKTRSR